MTYSPAKAMLAAARDSPTAQRLSASGFDIDMGDTDQDNALAMHVLHQLQILDANTRHVGWRSAVSSIPSQALRIVVYLRTHDGPHATGRSC